MSNNGSRIDHKPLELAIDALMKCSDIWFHEAGTYTLTSEYIKERSKLISVMKMLLKEYDENASN